MNNLFRLEIHREDYISTEEFLVVADTVPEALSKFEKAEECYRYKVKHIENRGEVIV